MCDCALPASLCLHGGRIQSELLTADPPTRDRGRREHRIQLLPGLGLDGIAQLAQGGVIHHRTSVDPREAAQAVAVVDPHHDLAQGRGLDDLAQAQTQHHLRGVDESSAPLASPILQLEDSLEVAVQKL